MIFRGAYNPITIPRIVHNYEQITDIPNLLFYYTASGLVTNTSNGYGIVDNSNKVSTLYSQVSPQINAIQLNGTTQPTLDIDGNGVKSVLFNGSTFFNFSSVWDIGFSTIVMVFKPSSNIVSGMVGQTIFSVDSGSRSILSGVFLGEASSVGINETITISSWRNPWDNYYFCGSYIKTSVSNGMINKLFINGDMGLEFILNGTPVTVYDFLPGSTGYSRVWSDPSILNGTLANVGRLGIQYDNSGGYNGRLYELMVFNRKLNSYEQTYIDYVLNLKYGI